MSVKGQTNGPLMGGWRSEGGGGEDSLFQDRRRLEKRMGDGAKLLSEAAAFFEPHQGAL